MVDNLEDEQIGKINLASTLKTHSPTVIGSDDDEWAEEIELEEAEDEKAVLDARGQAALTGMRLIIFQRSKH